MMSLESPRSSFFLILRSMKNNSIEVRTPRSPIIKKKNEECLKPISTVSALSTRYPVIKGTTHSAKLDMISIKLIAVPKTFFLTTIGIAATITFA